MATRLRDCRQQAGPSPKRRRSPSPSTPDRSTAFRSSSVPARKASRPFGPNLLRDRRKFGCPSRGRPSTAFLRHFSRDGCRPSRPVWDCVHRFEGWDQWLNVTAAQLRCVESAFDGVDGPDTIWRINREVLDTPRSGHWKKVFLDEWIDMHGSGVLAGVPVE